MTTEKLAYPGVGGPSVVIIGLSASFLRFFVTPDEPFDDAGAAASACGAAASLGCCEPFMSDYVRFAGLCRGV